MTITKAAISQDILNIYTVKPLIKDALVRQSKCWSLRCSWGSAWDNIMNDGIQTALTEPKQYKRKGEQCS